MNNPVAIPVIVRFAVVKFLYCIRENIKDAIAVQNDQQLFKLRYMIV